MKIVICGILLILMISFVVFDLLDFNSFFLEKPISLWSNIWFGFENIVSLPLCRNLVELVAWIVDHQGYVQFQGVNMTE